MRQHCAKCSNCGKCHPPIKVNVCPCCWKLNDTGAKVCKHCGHIFAAPPGKPMSNKKGQTTV